MPSAWKNLPFIQGVRWSRRSFLKASAISAAAMALGWPEKAVTGQKGPFTGGSGPAVVIGAGLGGLCCGAYLARMGFMVTVLERREVPGGYACTFERAGGRFVFDVSLHGTALRNNSAARILGELDVLDLLDLVELREIYRIITPQLTLSIPERDPEKYIQLLTTHFPSEAKGIRTFVQEVLDISEEAGKVQKSGMGPNIFFPFRYPKLYRVLDQTLAEFMGEHVKDPSLQIVLGSLWDFHGLPPSKVSALYYAAATGDSLRNGTYYIKRRSADLSRVLIEAIQAAGGRVRYNAPVESILVKREKAAGVVLKDGEIIPAPVVVSNVNVADTFKRMLPPGSVVDPFLEALKAFRPSLSTFIVWLGLNRDIRSKLGACGVQVMTGQGPEADYRSCLEGDIEKIPFRISIFDNMYDGYSAPGTGTLRIFCLSGYEPWRGLESAYSEGRKEAYNQKKTEWAQTLIRRAEGVIPGLSSMIEIQEAATPLTNRRYTRNTEGAIYGFEQVVKNAYLERIENRTPLKGLYITGAWSSPGGGFSGVLVSGQMAARAVIEDINTL